MGGEAQTGVSASTARRRANPERLQARRWGRSPSGSEAQAGAKPKRGFGEHSSPPGESGALAIASEVVFESRERDVKSLPIATALRNKASVLPSQFRSASVMLVASLLSGPAIPSIGEEFRAETAGEAHGCWELAQQQGSGLAL